MVGMVQINLQLNSHLELNITWSISSSSDITQQGDRANRA